MIRLSKVAREFNTGILTIAQFLESQGYSIELKPSTKLSLEQYELTVSELVSDNFTSLKGAFVSTFETGFSVRAPPLS